MFIQMPEYVERFETFTNLVTERFDIKVVLDGAKAQTDGSTISLPNIYGMTETEVEFLYGILLHEVGHIRHSCFDKELFKSFKSQAHFLLYNAIEDARIENAIMDEYAGAKDIFADLYARSNDPQFMQKVFGGDGKSPSDPFFIFGLMLHEHYITIPAPMGKVKKSVVTKAQEMFDSVKHLLNVTLKDGYDVQDLATKIYDIIFKAMQDKSEKIDIKADEKEKEDTQKGIDGMLKELEDIKQMADDMRKELQPIRDQKRGLRKQYKKENRASQKIQKAIDKAVAPLAKQLEENDPLDDAQHAVNALKRAMQRVFNDQQKLNNKIAKQEEGLNQAKDNKANAGKDQKLQKKAATKEKYHTNRKAKLEADKTPLAQKVAELQKELQDAKDKLNQEMNKPGANGKTPQQLMDEINQHEATDNPHGQAMNDLSNQIKPLTDKIAEANQKVADAREAALKKNMKAIMKAAQAANAAGLPSPIPPFTPNDDWSEADGVQKQFDNDAADKTNLPVVNGMSPFGSNLRDVIMRLTDVSNNLKTLDVTQVITRKLNKSKVENLESETDMNNIQDALEVNANGKMVRPHLPVTRAFDRVQEKTQGGDVTEINEIKAEKRMDITKVTQVLQRKFRFKTKNRFKPNQEDGQIDTRELWRIPHDLGTKIFETTVKKIDSKVQVAIAVDVSGSMDKDSTENGRKVKELTLILSEALTNAKVKHEIVGYGASPSYEVEGYNGGSVFNRKRHALETVVYKKLEGRSGLQNLELEPWDNADGESLRVVAGRLLKAGAKKKIMFVISDGKPYLTDEDTSVLDYDLHKAIDDCRKKKISVYGFGFNDSPKNFYGDKYCKVESTEKLVAFLNKNIETIS